ncbi:dihydroneopterin aldolase [Candidatus Odyssella thessalonicensis]|uniref:dihydroneopterin aldolase n=1 Tax=Candidatus Odyssella thessalonicensis TaxID=84647 RepID=UPI000225C126|nr:dihydroneopterin aldolase [Candidatus Odyssella thessalonicensis]
MNNTLLLSMNQNIKADKDLKNWSILINDLILDCLIGINPAEALAPQRVRINLKCQVQIACPDDQDYHGQFVCYDHIIQSISQLTQNRHIHLVETLAEEIAQMCLQDKRINKVWCRVEKLDVYSHTASVGVEIEREQLSSTTEKRES